MIAGMSVFVADSASALVVAEAKLTRALSLVPDHARGHAILGMAYIYSKRAARGIAECEHALALDRNLANAHSMIGFGKTFIGRAEETEGHIREALRLSPRDTLTYLWVYYVGLSKIYLDICDQAVTWFQRAIEANRNFPHAHFLLGAALARLDWLDEARSAVMAGLALNPSFTVARGRGNVNSMTDNPIVLAQAKRVQEAMRMAGAPSHDRRPPPRRDPRSRRRRLLPLDG